MLRVLISLGLLLVASVPSNAKLDFRCSNINERICDLAQPDFKYNDSCNIIDCDNHGSRSPYKPCAFLITPEQLQQCASIEMGIYSSLVGYVCPQLIALKVCSIAPVNYTFTDGCNTLRCVGDGQATGTERACPTADGPQQMQMCTLLAERLLSLTLSRGCGIDTEAVCRSRGPGFEFSDGCNRIFCGRNGEVTSTERGCFPESRNSIYCGIVVAAIEAAVTEPAVDSEVVGDVKSGDTDTGADTTAMPDTDADTTAMPDTDVDTTAMPDTDLDTTSMPDTDADTTAMPDTDADTTAMPDTDADTTAMPDTDVDTTAMPDTDVDTTAMP